MASIIKSIETLKGTSHSATKGVTDTAALVEHLRNKLRPCDVFPVQAAQDAVQQVADSSKETVSTAAQETNRQIQSSIGKAADKVTDTIKEFGKKMETK